MESVVVLCNHLHQMMLDQCGAKPSLATLNKAFAAYQTERKARMKHIMDYSSLITNVQAWRNPLYKFVATWVLPLQPDRAVADQLGEIIRGAPRLKFVDVDGASFPSGRLSWMDENENRKEAEKQKQMQMQKEKHKARNGGSGGSLFAHLTQMLSAAVALGLIVFLARYFRPLVSTSGFV